MKLVEAIVKPFKLNEIAIDRDMYVDCQHAGFFQKISGLHRWSSRLCRAKIAGVDVAKNFVVFAAASIAF